ncbi:MAG: thioredoxin [Bacteroidia bacterium]|nr:thioredoxin [Bacteroidia bacterium]
MQTTMIIIGAVVLAIGVLIYLARLKMKNIPVVEDHQNIVKLTNANFQLQTKNKLILVDFWASWCAPCRMMAPVLNDVARELNGNASVGKVNVEHEQLLAQKHKVRNIPTLVLFRNGKEIDRFVGVKSKEFLLQQIQKA